MQKYRILRKLTCLEKIKSHHIARLKDTGLMRLEKRREDSQGLFMRNVCPMSRSIRFTLKVVQKVGNTGVRKFNWGSPWVIKAKDLERHQTSGERVEHSDGLINTMVPVFSA